MAPTLFDARSTLLNPKALKPLSNRISRYLGSNDIQAIERAFSVADHAHKDQKRQTGEAYIYHPAEVALILAEMQLDSVTLIAALLHDTIEDTGLTKQSILETFGESVAELVDGVTKLDKLNFRSKQEAAAESFRKMLLAMTRDIRVILIKLADRLHNMRTLGVMEPHKKRRIAQETLDIYTPIANRLGMQLIKEELEDLCFKAIYPMRHRVLSDNIKSVRGHHKGAISKTLSAIKHRLLDEGIEHQITGREKSPFSIFRKMKSKVKAFKRITDVFGFRIIVESVNDCYLALGFVHSLYKPLNGRFKDYIAIPKSNGYQAIHTVLFGPFNAPIEIQIRTREMDKIARDGIASHWLYKDSNGDPNRPSRKENRARQWLLSLLQMQKQTGDSIEFIESVKIDLFPDEVYVFSPKGQIFELPNNATVLDYAYAVHTGVGNHCVFGRIDNEMTPIKNKLASGQTIEIITAESAHPTPDWLNFVVTNKARTAIRHYLKNLRHEEAVELGHRMLDRALDNLGINFESLSSRRVQRYLKNLKLARLEDLMAEIAHGNHLPNMVAKQLMPRWQREKTPHDRDILSISGSEGSIISYGNCCHPIPGDPIFGYLSAGKGIVVHRDQCPNLIALKDNLERWLEVRWDLQISGEFSVPLRIGVVCRPGVLARIASRIAQARCNIEHIDYQDRDGSTATLRIVIAVNDRIHLAKVIRNLRRSPSVLKINRGYD